jgi:hypothetical protein
MQSLHILMFFVDIGAKKSQDSEAPKRKRESGIFLGYSMAYTLVRREGRRGGKNERKEDKEEAKK